MMGPQRRLIRELAALFKKLGVEYLLIGGLAVKEYDDYRETYDVDLLMARVDGKTAGLLADELMGWAENTG